MAGPIVVGDEIINQKSAAGLERPAEFLEYLDVVCGSFLMSDMGIDRIVILRGAKIRLVKISIDGFETIGNAKLADESLCDFVYAWPVQLKTPGLIVGS